MLHIARINFFFFYVTFTDSLQVLSVVMKFKKRFVRNEKQGRSYLVLPSTPPFKLFLFVVRGGKRKLQSQVATGCRDRGNLQTRIGHLAGVVTHMRARHNLLWYHRPAFFPPGW